jgi:hypothetical protein
MKKDGRNALLVDDAPYLMLGAQVHNSSDWPAMPTKGWIRSSANWAILTA